MIWAEHHFGQNMTFFGKFLEDYLRGKVIFCREQLLQGQLFLGRVESSSRSAWQAAFQIPSKAPTGFCFGLPENSESNYNTSPYALNQIEVFSSEVNFFFSSHQIDERLRLIETRCVFFLIVGVGSFQAPLFGCKGFEHLDLSKTNHAKGFALGGLLGFSGLHGLLVESPSQLSPMCCFFFRGTRHRQFYRFLVNMAFARVGGKKSGLHRSQSKIVGFSIGEKIISAWSIGNFPAIQTLPEKNQVADLDWLTRRKRLEKLEEYIYI